MDAEDADFKVETRRLQSQNIDGRQMYPGLWRFLWAKAPWGWLLVSITREDERARA